MQVETTDFRFFIQSNPLFYLVLQPILIDARGHLLGRLAAVVAKTILLGKFYSIIKAQTRFAVTTKVIRAFVFSTWIVLFLFYLLVIVPLLLIS